MQVAQFPPGIGAGALERPTLLSGSRSSASQCQNVWQIAPTDLLYHASRECRVCSDTHLQNACRLYLLRACSLAPFSYASAPQTLCDHGRIYRNAVLALRGCIKLVGKPVPPILFAFTRSFNSRFQKRKSSLVRTAKFDNRWPDLRLVADDEVRTQLSSYTNQPSLLQFRSQSWTSRGLLGDRAVLQKLHRTLSKVSSDRSGCRIAQ